MFQIRRSCFVGGLISMGSKALPRVDAITTIDTTDGETILISMGGVAWDKCQVQHESSFNSHHLRSFGSVINDVAKEHGGGKILL